MQKAISDQLSPTHADALLQLHHHFQLTQVQAASARAALPSHRALPCSCPLPRPGQAFMRLSTSQRNEDNSREERECIFRCQSPFEGHEMAGSAPRGTHGGQGHSAQPRSLSSQWLCLSNAPLKRLPQFLQICTFPTSFLLSFCVLKVIYITNTKVELDVGPMIGMNPTALCNQMLFPSKSRQVLHSPGWLSRWMCSKTWGRNCFSCKLACKNGVIAQLRASRTHSTAALNLQILVSLEEQDGGTIQKINKSIVRHTRNFPVPYEWISGSCQKANLPPNTGHRMNLPFSSSILIPTSVSDHQLLNASYYNTVTRAGKSSTQQVSPFSKADITSCGIHQACPTHLLILRRNMDHSYSTNCSGDPENNSEGGQYQARATQASCPGHTGPRGCTERAEEE